LPRTPFSIDLSSIPPLSTPAPPSNTLLITNLDDLSVFHPASLATIRTHLSNIVPLHSFSPLKSLRRIIITFYSTEDAIQIRQLLDGSNVFGADVRARCYFGEPTPILGEEEEMEKRHLKAPQSQKLCFISPPPSPPVGWEMRNEEPPNKDIHAEDLASALAKLHHNPNAQQSADDMDITPISAGNTPNRQRSGSSTIIYNPEDHGNSPNLPAVMVEDTTVSGAEDEELGDVSPIDGAEKKIITHTARPPVELMDQS